MRVISGQTKTFEFRFTHYVNGAKTAYDPATLRASFLRGDGTEDVVTYGGNETGDNAFRRVSTGVYELNYTPVILGAWTLRTLTDDADVYGTWHGKLTTPLSFDVESDPHNYTDST